MRVVKDDTMRIPVKLWLDDIETKAMEQAVDLSRLPFAFHHVAIMPDSHVGYGMPIGGVLATHGAVIPNAVGVDIGCGMAIAKTSLRDIPTDSLKAWMGEIRKRVPVGFGHHHEAKVWLGFDKSPNVDVVQRELSAAQFQVGTLGGGNHFIEVQRGSDGYLYVMVHSGSRNFGLKIAGEYHKKAQALCERWFSTIPNMDLAFLPLDSQEGAEYIDAMGFALSFAKENRRQMIQSIADGLHEVAPNERMDEPFDIHHNYAAIENHFGHNVIVHRKGAVRAREGEQGIIPGSQGTASYVVKGKGNPESFMSSSHGAGRKMGRKQAQRELSLDDEKRRLDEQGIIHAVRSTSDLDEAPGSYKDIDAVMANQTDLVDVVLKLRPLAVVKG